jgi:tripartite-type tricarboxylate transporter receptor subunit TctC
LPTADLQAVPFVNDLAHTPEDQQAIEFLFAGVVGLGRPFIAPPGMPAERMKMVQDAFMTTMKDADFLADAKKQKLDVVPTDGEHFPTLVKKIYATPKLIVDKIAELIK